MAKTYATLDPSNKSSNITLSGGNLTASNGSATWDSVKSTIGVSSGKWYWEMTATTLGSGQFMGVAPTGDSNTTYVGAGSNSYSYLSINGNKYNNNSATAYATSWSAGNVIGVALDMDAGTIKFFKNNTDLGQAYSGITGTQYAMCSCNASGSAFTVNFGATAMTYSAPVGYNQGLYSGSDTNTLGEYLGAGSGTTKLLLHLNGSSADSSGNSNNGTDTSITYSQANGKFGQGAGFNSGNTSYITLPNLSTGTGDFTLSLWINTTTYGTNKRYYISQQNSGAPYNTFQLNYASPNLYFGHYDGSTDLNLNIPTLPSTGAWYNIIFTKNGNTGSVYVNGSLAVSGTGWSSRNCGEAHYNGLGLSGSNSFYGAMDEVIKELGVAWSAEKVKKYYTNSRGRYGII